MRIPRAKPTILKALVGARTILYALAAAGAAAGGYYAFNAQSAIHEYLFCPLIRQVTNAEQGHQLGIWLMLRGLSPRVYAENDLNNDPLLKATVFGNKTLASPVGLAAGMDKGAEAVEGLFDIGFSYVEIGLVTPKAQPGNPQPRFFRLPRDDAVINRYGFNLEGHTVVAARLRQRLQQLWDGGSGVSNAFRPNRMLAVNLGKNKTGDEVQDYVEGVQRLGQFADVLVINVLLPNTPGLRDLQLETKLTNLLKTVVAARDVQGANRLGEVPPVMVKVAPDLTEPEIALVAQLAKDARVDGIIISNTTVQRPVERLLTTDQELIHQAGGLSGAPLKPLLLKALRTLYKYTKGSGLTLVGCGGIQLGADAVEFGKAGANFVQLYTALAYKGPGLVNRIQREIKAELAREGKTWDEIVGSEQA